MKNYILNTIIFFTRSAIWFMGWAVCHKFIIRPAYLQSAYNAHFKADGVVMFLKVMGMMDEGFNIYNELYYWKFIGFSFVIFLGATFWFFLINFKKLPILNYRPFNKLN